MKTKMNQRELTHVMDQNAGEVIINVLENIQY